jgi:small subunit ribosomal protein S20
MPNKPSAKKALRQATKRNVWNNARRAAFRNAIKKALKATSAEEATKLIKEAQKALDKAAKRGVIKKNTAARKLSRLVKKVKAKK